MAVVVKTVLGSHFGVGEFTTHFRLYFSGDWDVHLGVRDFDPRFGCHHWHPFFLLWGSFHLKSTARRSMAFFPLESMSGSTDSC